jgi:hypothetical protein
MNRKSFIASLLGIAGLALKSKEVKVSSGSDIKRDYLNVHGYTSLPKLNTVKVRPFAQIGTGTLTPYMTEAQRLSLKKHMGLMVQQIDGDKGLYIVNPGFNELVWAKLTYA